LFAPGPEAKAEGVSTINPATRPVHDEQLGRKLRTLIEETIPTFCVNFVLVVNIFTQITNKSVYQKGVSFRLYMAVPVKEGK